MFGVCKTCEDNNNKNNNNNIFYNVWSMQNMRG